VIQEDYLGLAPLDRQTFYLIQRVPGQQQQKGVEWAYLNNVTSLFSLIFIHWEKKNADSVGTGANINREECTMRVLVALLPSISLFLSDFFVSCTQQVPLRKSNFQNQ